MRYEEWINSSDGLRFIDAMLVGNAQGLGLIDVELIDKFPRLKINSELKRDCLNKLRHITLSELWTMGAYDLVRLTGELVAKNKEIYSKDTIKEIKKVKQKFEEVRVPLVKFRKRGRSAPLFSGVPWPTFHPKKGAGWKIYTTNNHKVNKAIVYRINLSNSLLKMLKKMKEDIYAKSIIERTKA